MDPFTALIIAVGAAWATLGRGLVDTMALARGQTPPSVARRQGKNDLERERIRAAQTVATTGASTEPGNTPPSSSTRGTSTSGLASAVSLEPRRIRIADVMRHRWEDFLEEKDQRLRERHLAKPERKQRRTQRRQHYRQLAARGYHALGERHRGWANRVLDNTPDAHAEPEPQESLEPEAEPEAGPEEEGAAPDGDVPEEPKPDPEPSGEEPDSSEDPAPGEPEEGPAPETDESSEQHQPEEDSDQYRQETTTEESTSPAPEEPGSSNTPDPDSSLGQVIPLHPNQDQHSSAPSTTQGDTAMATTTDGEISGYADALNFTQRMEEESAQAARVFEDNAEALTSYQLPQNIIADIHAAHDAAEEMRQALGRARQELERQRDVAEAVETAGGSHNIAKDTSFYDDN